MFSLDALALRAQPPPGVGQPAEEDSGLIDLRALASGSATRREVASTAASVDGSLFPLGAPSTDSLATAAKPPPVPGERGSRGGAERLVVAVLATVALLLGATVVFLLVRQGQPPAGASSPPGAHDSVVAERSQPEGGHAPSGPPSDPSDPGSGPEPSGSAVPPSDTTPSRLVATRVPSPSTSPRPETTGSPTATTPSRATAPACPCPPDDLMCNMRCSVGR